jgi:hypothetical protein
MTTRGLTGSGYRVPFAHYQSLSWQKALFALAHVRVGLINGLNLDRLAVLGRSAFGTDSAPPAGEMIQAALHVRTGDWSRASGTRRAAGAAPEVTRPRGQRVPPGLAQACRPPGKSRRGGRGLPLRRGCDIEEIRRFADFAVQTAPTPGLNTEQQPRVDELQAATDNPARDTVPLRKAIGQVLNPLGAAGTATTAPKIAVLIYQHVGACESAAVRVRLRRLCRCGPAPGAFG